MSNNLPFDTDCTVNKLICVQENITSTGTLRTSLQLIFIAPNQLSNSITKIYSFSGKIQLPHTTVSRVNCKIRLYVALHVGFTVYCIILLFLKILHYCWCRENFKSSKDRGTFWLDREQTHFGLRSSFYQIEICYTLGLMVLAKGKQGRDFS